MLQPGRAVTRNAIKLLRLMDYDPEIVSEAAEAAIYFEETGLWKKLNNYIFLTYFIRN